MINIYKVAEMIVFANNVDPNEVAQNDPSEANSFL